VPREVVPEGGDWYSNAAALADLDGDGHLDLIVGNYFPDGARVLDAGTAATGRMQDSMSRSFGGGRNRLLLRCAGEARFMDASAVLPEELSSGWTLAVAAAAGPGRRASRTSTTTGSSKQSKRRGSSVAP
jgi:hypothetical protein